METLTIRRKIHFKLGRNNRNKIVRGTPTPIARKPSRSAELMAFAIVFDDSLEQGKFSNLSDICIATGLSRAAVSRIMRFRLKPPEVQDRLIFCTK
ncbi:MAG: hypothetical protein J6P03_05920 [Opitutales bacterium]|nr:hypothetical protein [Opitutales bacterium]